MNLNYNDWPEFNDFLDEVDGPGGEPKMVFIGREFASTPSRLLFDADIRGYEEEFRMWQSSRLVHMRNLVEDVIARHGNKTRIEEVVRRLKRGTITPFVGAGLSVPSGYPSWSAFLIRLAESRGWDLSVLELRIADGEHEQIVEELQKQMPAALFDERIEDIFHTSHTSRPPRGAIVWVPKLRCPNCVTTNLDRCLESVFRDSNLAFEQVAYGSDPKQLRAIGGAGDRWLLKLHGDAGIAESKVLSFSDYERAYGGDGGAHRETLEWICDHRSLLFLGCGLRGDRVLSELLRVAKEGKGLRHYAVVEEPEGGVAERCEREDFLAKRKIFPIWYPPGEHDYVEALLFFFADEVG